MKSSKNAQGKTMPESAGKGRQGVGGNGNLRPVRDGNERSRGRKAGVPNKTTRILKEAILQAAEELGELERRTAVIKSENAPVRKVRGPALPGNPGRPLGSKNKVTQLEQLAEGRIPIVFSAPGRPPTRVVAKFRTIGETVELFNTSTRTVRRLIESGDLRVHIRGLARISDADIAAFLAEN